MVDVAQFYQAFGKSVIAEIQVNLNRSGDLRDLLTKFNVPVPTQVDAQHEMMRRILIRYGPLFFMTVAKSDFTREQIDKMKQNMQAGVETPMPGSGRRLTPTSTTPSEGERLGQPNLYERPRIEKDHPSEPPPSAPAQRVDPPKQIMQPRSPYSAPSRRNNPTPIPPPVTPVRGTRRSTDPPNLPPQISTGYVETADYRGRDRRVLADRRMGPRDRREDLEITFKNKRFGGRDRRKNVRRQSDRLNSRRA